MPANTYRAADGIVYATVAASQTTQTLTSSGGTGAVGDYLAGLLVVPTSTSPGVISIVDGGTTISVFAGGASSVLSLVPFFIPVGACSINTAWKVTTGANLSVVAIGQFS